MTNTIQRITDISQGSSEWKLLRAGKYVSSTLSYKIRNKDVPASAIQQFKGVSDNIDPALSSMGHSGEEQCRNFLRDTGHDIINETPIYIDPETMLLSSIDGESSCKSVLYEFKTCVSTSSATYKKASTGVVPPQHMYQIQHTLALGVHQRALYVVCTLDNGTTGQLNKDSIIFIHVKPDPVIQKTIIERAKTFLKQMKDGSLQVPKSALPSNHKELTDEYINLKGSIDLLTRLAEEKRQELISIGVHEANNIAVTKVNGRKKTDFEAALKSVENELDEKTKETINQACQKFTTFGDDHFKVVIRKPFLKVDTNNLG